MPEYPDYDTFMKKMPPLLPYDSGNEELLKEFLVRSMWPSIGAFSSHFSRPDDPRLSDFISGKSNNPNGVKRDILSYLVSLDDGAIKSVIGVGSLDLSEDGRPPVLVKIENVRNACDVFLKELHKVRLERLSINKLRNLDVMIKNDPGYGREERGWSASLGILNDKDKAIIENCRETIAKDGIPFTSEDKNDTQRKSTPMHLLTKLGLGGAIIAVIGLSAVSADKSFTGGEYLSTVKDFGSETIDSMSNMIGGKKKKRRTKRKSTKKRKSLKRRRTKRRKSTKRKRY